MADVRGEGDPGKRPNTPPGAMSREDLFKKSDDEHENSEDFTDVPDEAHDQLTEVTEEGVETEVKREAVPEKKYKIKINGQDREVTESELVSLAQKGEGADQKFQEAARLRKEVDDLLKQQAPKEPAVEPKVTDDDLALARALQMGSEEEAARVIKGLRDRPTLKEEDVVRKIDERLTFQSSVERFKSEFPAIFNDTNLMNLAMVKDQQLVASGDSRPYYERYKTIGEEIMTWVGNVKPQDKKQERKASITVLPQASARAQGEPEEDIDESASEVIAKMAKGRGQTVVR